MGFFVVVNLNEKGRGGRGNTPSPQRPRPSPSLGPRPLLEQYSSEGEDWVEVCCGRAGILPLSVYSVVNISPPSSSEVFELAAG